MALRRRWLEITVVVLAVAETVSVIAGGAAREPAGALVTALSVLVLLGFRWQPLAACIAAFLCVAVGLAVTPESTGPQFLGTLATFAIAGSIATNREAIVAWTFGAAMLAYASFVDPAGGGLSDFTLSLAFCTAMWSAGWLVSRQFRSAAAARVEAERAARGQLEVTRRAVAAERAAIARELHDVVSHGLSVVIVQTVAAQATFDDLNSDRPADPARTAAERGELGAHLDAVESTARDALGEMRRMLGLLQVNENAEGADLDQPTPSPSPGLTQLPQLIDRARSAGLTIDDSGIRGDLVLPPGLDLAVYRIVQEALTNVIRHAPGAHVELRVEHDTEGVALTVRNEAGHTPIIAQPGSGRGLVGMRERAALYDGEVDFTATNLGGFEVHAHLPVAGLTAKVRA